MTWQGSPAARLADVQPSKTIEMAGRALHMKGQGIDVASLSVGEPDFDTPVHIKQAGIDAINGNQTHYTASPGIPQLREAIARKYRQENGVDAEPDHVVAAPTKFGLFASALAFIDPGDEVLLPDPCFVSYAPIVRLAGGVPVWVPTRQENGYSIEADVVAESIGARTRMIWLCSPSNPTGGVDDPAELRGVVDLARDKDFLILSDEIYEKLQFDGRPLSPASLAYERTITVGGLSKSHAMTGWRAGWVVAPPPLLAPIADIQSQSITQVATFVQHAMVAALTGPQDEVLRMRETLRNRRDQTLQMLAGVEGASAAVPRGAFYVWLGYDSDIESQQVADHLLDKHHVAVVPGHAFGPSGRRRLRLSYGGSMEEVGRGIQRLEHGLRELQSR